MFADWTARVHIATDGASNRDLVFSVGTPAALLIADSSSSEGTTPIRPLHAFEKACDEWISMSLL